MNRLTIAIKNKTNLTQQLEKIYTLEYYKKPTFLSQFISKNSSPCDIYFHRGFTGKEEFSLLEQSKLTFVNSQALKKELLSKKIDINENKIKVIYPYYHSRNSYDKTLKKEFRAKHNIEKKSKIILFRGNDLSKSGLAYLFDTLNRMYKKNFTLIIESTSKQIIPLRLQLERAKLEYATILFEDYENPDELFNAADIFILPTQQKYFALDSIRAMYFRNVVFIMETNHAAELLDLFSLIQDENDKSTSFKLDSLLISNVELKKIQKENQKIAYAHSLENSVVKMKNIISKTFDI